jgi:Family of unknown function (DUF6338)
VSSLLKLLTTTPQALVLLLFLLVPGFIFIRVFDNLLPGRLRSFSQQVIDILCWSFTILALWLFPALIVFGLSQRVSGWLFHLLLSALILLGVFGTPILLAYIFYRLELRGTLKNWGTHPTPSSWDWFFSNRKGNHYVRFHLKQGTQLGGYFGENSFATSSPEPQEIYVEEVWRLDEDGRFVERVEGTDGAMVNREDCELIAFFKTREARDGKTLEGGLTESVTTASDTNPKPLGR